MASKPDVVRLGRLDVAVLCYDRRGSGVVRNAHRLLHALSESGLRTAFVVMRNAGDLAHETLPDDVELIELVPPTTRLGRSLSMAVTVPTLRQWLAEGQPYVLLSAGSHAHPFAALAVRGLRPRPRLIMRVSNDLLHHRQSGIGRLCSSIAERALKPIRRAVLGEADRLVAVAHGLQEQLRKHCAIPTSSITVIPNGVDAEAVAVRSQHPIVDEWLDGPIPVVVGMGRLSTQKNFAHLIRTIAAANEVRPVRLIILGSGSARQKSRLAGLAETEGIGDMVRFQGFVPNPYAYLSRADLFVQTSLWEGLPNALLEALACGCPVVATECPTGLREVLRTPKGYLGPIVEQGNVAVLAKAVLSRLEEPRKARELVAQARRFDAIDMRDRYVDLVRREVAFVRCAEHLAASNVASIVATERSQRMLAHPSAPKPTGEMT